MLLDPGDEIECIAQISPSSSSMLSHGEGGYRVSFDLGEDQRAAYVLLLGCKKRNLLLRILPSFGTVVREEANHSEVIAQD